MSYCPDALMEEIGSSSSSSGNNILEIQVPFPSLNHPPTDSEATTATTATSATTSSASTTTSKNDEKAASSDEQRRCNDDDQNTSDQGDVAVKVSSKRKREALDNEATGTAVNGKRHQHSQVTASESAARGLRSATLKDLPENQLPRQQPKQSSSPHDSSPPASPHDVDDEDIEIDELDFGNGSDDDPSERIKTALHKYVVAVKRRKKQLEEEERLKKDCSLGAAGDQASKSSPASTEGECSNNNKTAVEVGKGSGKLLSLEQQPIQVIMSWMDSFQDHEKIQLICLQSLPTILESPQNRIAAQAGGLASIVLYDMAAFLTNSLLQLTAFHTLVVLLRPLGANEGTVHRMRTASSTSSRTNDAKAAPAAAGSCGTHGAGKSTSVIRSIHHKKHKTSINAIHNTGRQQHPLLDAIREPSWTENGVRVMLDSLRRFSSDRYLQAMGCWAMVNAALYPTLKRSLLRLGGVYAVTNAMMLHPNVEAVQFRGLFALINLVIPDNKSKKKEYRAPNDGSSIHSHIYQIARLTIVAMKNFHANKSILNRGCLVLRNLSLTPAFVEILARTPGCVDMLLHCRQVCGPRDVLVQRSARTIMILVQRVVTGGNKEGANGDAVSIAFGDGSAKRPKI